MLRSNTQVTFEPTSHTYLNHEWKELLGVTSLMKKHGLSADYAGIPAEILQRAAARGSAIHKEIEDYCNLEPSTGRQSAECRAFAELRLVVEANEYLVSDNQTTATMIDIVLAGYSLVDIKTTSTFHHEAVSWQLSICAYLFELQNPHIKVGDLYGLHLRGASAKMIKVERKASDEIARLFECERNGELYRSSDTEIVTAADAELCALFDLEQFIAHIQIEAKEAKENREKMIEKIYARMEAEGQKKIETDRMTITRILPSVRKGVDSDWLKTVHPKIYAECLKESQIKGSIRITLK